MQRIFLAVVLAVAAMVIPSRMAVAQAKTTYVACIHDGFYGPPYVLSARPFAMDWDVYRQNRDVLAESFAKDASVPAAEARCNYNSSMDEATAWISDALRNPNIRWQTIDWMPPKALMSVSISNAAAARASSDRQNAPNRVATPQRQVNSEAPNPHPSGRCPYHEAEACSRWYNGH